MILRWEVMVDMPIIAMEILLSSLPSPSELPACTSIPVPVVDPKGDADHIIQELTIVQFPHDVLAHMAQNQPTSFAARFGNDALFSKIWAEPFQDVLTWRHYVVLDA